METVEQLPTREASLEALRLRRDDVADTAARIRDVAGVARDDVDVQVKDGLARGRANVPADVEAVGPIMLEDLLACNGDGGDQIALLLGGGVPPGGDVTARDDKGMSRGDGECVPQAQDQLAGMEDSFGDRRTEGAAEIRHGALRASGGGK
jgi:hypothetical protein